MKKEYINPNVEIISIVEEDIIRTSQQFGGSMPGLEGDDSLLG